MLDALKALQEISTALGPSAVVYFSLDSRPDTLRITARFKGYEYSQLVTKEFLENAPQHVVGLFVAEAKDAYQGSLRARSESSYVDSNNVRIKNHDILEFDGEYTKCSAEVIYRTGYKGEYAWMIKCDPFPETLTLEKFLKDHPKAVIVK